jgi:hypothetical protein
MVGWLKLQARQGFGNATTAGELAPLGSLNKHWRDPVLSVDQSKAERTRPDRDFVHHGVGIGINDSNIVGACMGDEDRTPSWGDIDVHRIEAHGHARHNIERLGVHDEEGSRRREACDIRLGAVGIEDYADGRGDVGYLPSVRTKTGTQQPMGASAGTVKMT